MSVSRSHLRDLVVPSPFFRSETVVSPYPGRTRSQRCRHCTLVLPERPSNLTPLHTGYGGSPDRCLSDHLLSTPSQDREVVELHDRTLTGDSFWSRPRGSWRPVVIPVLGRGVDGSTHRNPFSETGTPEPIALLLQMSTNRKLQNRLLIKIIRPMEGRGVCGEVGPSVRPHPRLSTLRVHALLSDPGLWSEVTSSAGVHGYDILHRLSAG